jgi:ATP-binding cassette subfamily B protein
MKDKTSIVIAHRLAPFKLQMSYSLSMVELLFSKAGHEELIKLDGLYAHLYQTQFRNQESGCTLVISAHRTRRLTITDSTCQNY